MGATGFQNAVSDHRPPPAIQVKLAAEVCAIGSTMPPIISAQRTAVRSEFIECSPSEGGRVHKRTRRIFLIALLCRG